MKKLLFLLLIPFTLFAQGKRNKDLTINFLEPDLVIVGVTKDELVKELKNKGVFKEYWFSKNQGLEDDLPWNYKYTYSKDVRINNTMNVTTYDYYIKNDTCFTVSIKPSTFKNWRSEVDKEHEFLADEEKGKGKIYHKYISDDKRYKLFVIERLNKYNQPEMIVQATKN